jgi:hypothetical protein
MQEQAASSMQLLAQNFLTPFRPPNTQNSQRLYVESNPIFMSFLFRSVSKVHVLGISQNLGGAIGSNFRMKVRLITIQHSHAYDTIKVIP